MSRLWYKNAIIYSLDVESFMDVNSDGIGDLKGLRHRLNYLSHLGVNCIWLLPFYDTPNRDNGYDVRDYYQVDKRLGDLGHFAELIDEAQELGIRIIIDLIVNHTSEEHFWFQEARKSRDSKFRDFYIWRDEKPEEDGKHVIFGKEQGDSNWKYDQETEAYYYHSFYAFQPDLNLTNPAVQDEIMRIMHFWMKLGVSGFRIDAAPHMVREKGREEFEGDPHEIFRRFRNFLEGQKQDAILLAEVDVEPERYTEFFGKQDQMHLLLNFYLNNYLFLALTREEAAPVADAMRTLPERSEKEQMANFVRNHDELDLERLSNEEREEVFKAFAPDEDMRVFKRGIRRRLAPMLKNDRRKIELAYSLLFTLPGSPVLRYGQEIGMGEDLSLKGRNSVRTTMQWSGEKNGGFSNAPEDKIVRACISEGPFSYKNINVTGQQRDPNSLLSWMARAINYRKETPEFGRGKMTILEAEHPGILAFFRSSGSGLAMAVHNFSNEQVSFKPDIDFAGEIIEIFGDKKYEEFDAKTGEMSLEPHGFRWFRKRRTFL